MRILALCGGILLVALTSPAATPIAGRIGDRAFIQVEAPSFDKLTPRQKILSYYLAQAAIRMDPIFYGQMSWYGIEAKKLLTAMVEDPSRLPANNRAAIVDYAALFLGNNGNHNETTGSKFVPPISWEDFCAAAEEAREKGARLGSRQFLAQLLEKLRRPLFDPHYDVNITVKNPPPGKDILTASSNNFYRGVTMKDLASFTEAHPLDSLLVNKDGRLVEEVYRAGTPDGKIPAGLYADELKAVVKSLEKAADYAAPPEAEVIHALARYYETGDPADWRLYNILWLKNNPTVDFASGFIEVYRDARGVKGSSQMLVSITDQTLNPLMRELAANAGYFEQKEPWDGRFKKKNVHPPVAKAVETIIETGDFSVSTIGDNLPNEQDIRQEYGTKSILLTSSITAFDESRGARVAGEFSLDPAAEEKRYVQYGAIADNLHTAMHEIIGHGSGQVVVPGDPATYLKEYYSTMEEARADLVAYWNIYDPKLEQLGVHDLAAVGHELYNQLARAGLTTLNHYPSGDEAQEDHDRNRLMIVNYLIAHGAFEMVKHNGHYYIVVQSYEKAHEEVGKLLAEIMRIKATGDYEGIKSLVQQYGIHFDPAVRDDVVARFKKLDIPTYYSGVYPDLMPVRDAAGTVVDVKISYPRDFLKQRLEWARENGTLGF